MASKIVLITGISGFTGIYLEKLLISFGYQVYGITFSPSKNKNHFFCDLLDYNKLKDLINYVKPNYVFHLAGISSVLEKSRSLIYDVNVIGTENLLESIVKSNLFPEKVIIASSATVYGNVNNIVLDESLNPSPINHYGCSKLVVEHISKVYFDKLNIIITRPFNYTGAGQSVNYLFPKIVHHFLEKKKNIELGNIDVARELNDVNDISNVYYKLMLCNKSGIVVNLCSGKVISISEVILFMESFTNHKIDIIVNPSLVRENEIKVLKGSNNFLCSILDYEFKFQFKDTIKSMYNFKNLFHD
jgi:nucleoside-diphosphate-sugar epimerase